MKLDAQVVLCRVTDVQGYSFSLESKEELEVIDLTIESFGINDARYLSDIAYQRPQTASEQLLLIRMYSITLEAQNALLKLFEEPPSSTRIMLAAPHDTSFLPTLLSRVLVISEENESGYQTSDAFIAFLSGNIKDRLLQIEDAHKRKDVVWQRSIKQGLMDSATQDVSLRTIPAVGYVSRHLLTRGASNKMLLEHLAISLPVRGSGV